jgi:hypothetical protein
MATFTHVIFVTLLAMTMAKGLVNSHPEPTPFLQASPEGRHARSPKPSAVSARQLDTATLGSTLVNQLFAREALYTTTCGYTRGEPTLPIICADGDAEPTGCVYLDGSPATFWCCALDESRVPILGRCDPVTKCLDYTKPGNSNSGNGPFYHNGTVDW